MPNYGYSEYGMYSSWIMTQLKYPSESLELADCSSGLLGNTNTNWEAGAGGSSTEGAYENSVPHNGGVNLEFYDGHVEFRNWRSVRRYGMGGNLRYHDSDVK